MTTLTATVKLTERPRPTALRAAWLLDGSGAAAMPSPVVVFDGSTILSVQSGGPDPTGVDVVDLGSATLLPGLVDPHVHLAFDASADPVASLADRHDSEVTEAMRTAGRTMLTGGVTTVRDLGDRDYLSLALRRADEMPTLVAAGPPITTPGGHCHFLGGVARPGVDGVRDAVREHAERGVDVIKVMASGGQLTPGTEQHRPQFSDAEIAAAVDEAHRLGLPVTMHAHATAAIHQAITAGVDGIEHASFWSKESIDDPGDTIDHLARADIAVGATVGIKPVPGVEMPPEVLRRVPIVMSNFARMHQAGVRLLAGSDAGIAPIKPHDSLRYAFPQLVAVGMSAAEVVRTVTSVAARACGLVDSKGRIAAGYDADILAVAGNLLDDLDNIHHIRTVYCRGRLVG